MYRMNCEKAEPAKSRLPTRHPNDNNEGQPSPRSLAPVRDRGSHGSTITRLARVTIGDRLISFRWGEGGVRAELTCLPNRWVAIMRSPKNRISSTGRMPSKLFLSLSYEMCAAGPNARMRQHTLPTSASEAPVVQDSIRDNEAKFIYR